MISDKLHLRALIFTGGDCDTELLLPHLHGDYLGDDGQIAADVIVIAADSGYQTAQRAAIIPHIIIGDMDSISALPDDASGIEIIRANPEKDDTDTMLAVKTACDRGAVDILIAGGTGGRCDHTLSNVFLLEHLGNDGIKCALTDGGNFIRVLKNGTLTLRKRGYRYFSVVALEDSVVTVTGCAYPLENATLVRSYPYAVSNEILPGSDEAVVTVVHGAAVVIES
jgi:thiamine pyrophosphokinase